MKRTCLLFTTILAAACSSEGRKANPDEQQAASAFVRSALSISDSFANANAMPALPVALGHLPDGMVGCVVRTADRLTLHCTEGGVTVVGSLVHGGNRVTMDLHATGRVSMDFTGELTITLGDVNGTLNLRAAADSVSVRASAAYDHLKLDAARCPVGGRLRFDAETSARSHSESRDLEIGFGPACGDVTVFD
jgi:hypothetical protein